MVGFGLEWFGMVWFGMFHGRFGLFRGRQLAVGTPLPVDAEGAAIEVIQHMSRVNISMFVLDPT